MAEPPGSPLIGTGKAGSWAKRVRLRRASAFRRLAAVDGPAAGGSWFPACARDGSWCRWRCHAVKVDDFKPKAGDPLHQPGEGSRVGQFGMEGGRIRACGDVAFVELCAQHFVGRPVKVISYVSGRTDYASQSVV